MNVSGSGGTPGYFREGLPSQAGPRQVVRFGEEPLPRSTLSSLLVVGLGGEMVAAAHILSRCTGIPHVVLDLASAAWLPAGVAKALSNNCTISRVDIIGAAGLSVEDLGLWMLAIGRMNGLTHLVIDISDWSQEQCETIARCLGRFSNLRTLDLPGGRNRLPAGVIEAVRSCPWLCSQGEFAATSQVDFTGGSPALQYQQPPGTPSWQTVDRPTTPSMTPVTSTSGPPATPNQLDSFESLFNREWPPSTPPVGTWGGESPFRWGTF